MNVIFWNDIPNRAQGKPPILYRYIGPYKVADWVRKHGYTAQVIDFVTFLTEDELWKFTTKFITDETIVLGISTTFISQGRYNTSRGMQRLPDHLLNVMARIKEEYPKIKIVLGGAWSEAIGTWKIIHGAVVGKAEDIFLELLDHYKKGTSPPKHVIKMPTFGGNLVAQYYEANNKKYDIESDSFRFSKQDCILPGETLPLEVSRGCIFKCKFCQYENLGRAKLDYLRASKCIEEELLFNYENYGTTNYQVLCDTFNDTTYKVTEWYKMTQRLPFKINFCAYIRADLLHRYEDTCYQLKESGLLGAFHGLETLTPEAAKLVGKGWSGKHARSWIPKLYHDIWKRGVSQHLSMIVGLPRDPQSNVNDWVKWFIDNNLHSIKFGGLTMLRDPWRNSSEFERNAAQYGFKFSDQMNWSNDNWTYESAELCAEKLNADTENYRKFNNWISLSLLTYGYDKEYILKTKQIDYDKSVMFSKGTEFIEKYKALLSEL